MTDTCSGCGRPVTWVVTEAGRRVELDPDPHPDGNVVPVTVAGHRRARVLSGDQLPAEGPAWRRHASTCTESPAARQRRARTAPRCRVCNLPMDPGLARREQWTEHPACDTTAGAQHAREALRTQRRETA